MSAEERRWSEAFRRVPALEETRPLFSIRGAIEHLYSEDGYRGGHDDLDSIVKFCEDYELPIQQATDPGSPMNDASRYEAHYSFLDGGLHIYSGNYFFQDRGAYIEGFLALRWVLYKLGYTQPRRLKGEEQVLSHKQLEQFVTG